MINFMIGNFAEPKRAKEIITTYISNFKTLKNSFSNKLKKNQINILVENFQQKSFRNEIKEMKLKHEKTKFCVLFTEHLTKYKENFMTFNYFGDLEAIDYQIYMRNRFLDFQDIVEYIDIIFALDEKDLIDLKNYYKNKIVFLLPEVPLIK